ncbi:MAG: serine/threonine-protein kinase [Nocardioides sp.]
MGEVFAGRYELLDPVAVGGMGTVWCVLDRADHQVKAAKILRQSDAASLLRFVREQSMRIDHSHVVTPQSWAGMDDRVLFTMPLVRGGSVSQLLKAYGVLPPRWTALLVDQTLQALEAVHAAGIIHRDVKPANLLLEPTGRGMPHLRLTDFGIAIPLDEPRMTRTSMIVGSPGYMAPEQWRGADPDERADIYSVGRVGIQMLTGLRPPAEDADVDLSAYRTGDAGHDALLDLFDRAVSREPAGRPASAAAMRAELRALDLTSRPPEPGESITVVDTFGDLATVGSPTPATAAMTATVGATGLPAGKRDGSPADATRVQPVPSSAGRGSPLPGIVLIVVGVLSIVAALVLLLA